MRGGIRPHGALFRQERGKHVRRDVRINFIIRLVGSALHVAQGKREIIHSVSARRTVFDDEIGKALAYFLQPAYVSAVMFQQPVPAAFRPKIGARARFDVVIKFEIIYPVFFHHVRDDIFQPRPNLPAPEIQLVPVGKPQPLSLPGKIIFRFIGFGRVPQRPHDFRLQPQTKTHRFSDFVGKLF